MYKTISCKDGLAKMNTHELTLSDKNN